MLELLESLDEKVFTEELKESLEAQFNEAVETKANEIAEAKINEEIEVLHEKAEEYTEILSKKSDEHIEFLNEKADAYVQMKQEEMLENIDKYLDRVVDEFVSEAKSALDESVKSEKADMIIEAFESMLIASGVEVSKIVEAKDESEAQAKLDASNNKVDNLVEEIMSLTEENEKLIKMGVIAEMTEDLSIVEAQKFKTLANLVEFSRDQAFFEKLETIKENVKGSVKTEEETATTVVESQEEPAAPTAPAWAHLV